MKPITLKLTLEELRLLASLASDQLFRRQFIDPRMPGHRAKPGEVELGKALVGRLLAIVDRGSRDAESALTASMGSDAPPLQAAQPRGPARHSGLERAKT